MPSILNATTTSGLVTSADNSGSLQLQTNNGTTAVTIDTSQNVGIGTSSPSYKLDVQSGTARIYNSTFPSLRIQNSATGTNSNDGLLVEMSGSDALFVNYESANMIFKTADTERMRITSGGNFLVGDTTPIGTDGNLLANADYTATYRSTTNTGAYVHAFASDVTTTRSVKYAIYANGTAGAVSDANLKKNIEPARNYLNDLMKIEVVKYNWKSDEDSAPKELGYIAQQVETVFPAMVDEQIYKDGNGEEVTQKMLKKEVFIPMMLKAIQELKAELDATKAEVQALKGVA